MRSIGVEEELLLVDDRTGRPLAVARQALRSLATDGGTAVTNEIQQEMVEAVSRPHRNLDGLGADLVAGRERADVAARAAGARAAALATSPVAASPHATDSARYRAIMDRFGIIGRESLTCGFHIHVSIASPEEGVAVLDRIRTWLPVVLALSTNSPFWQAEDTGYQSYRSQVWGRWPCAGPTDLFGSVDAYRWYEQCLLDTGGPVDEGMLYFDARLSRSWPTVEVRVADVCLDPQDAVTIAGLVRGLVDTAAGHWRAGAEPRPVPSAALRVASWRAGRSGVGGQLVDPRTGRPRPAEEVVLDLLATIRPALVENGDDAVVADGTSHILARGTGATRQRAARAAGGRMTDAVMDAVRATHDQGRTGMQRVGGDSALRDDAGAVHRTVRADDLQAG
ncbi:carboxylate-amine ligase [Plantibacter cousiniae (nom. nud.)]|uniref:Putative glutamate--cysteine ligase 2 n=1 Tax=Plantibacter cousiniae (nom. nud.) TaxID=199709 RepID=A0ABY1LK48_9MICO|nr:glutamate--cysteine ligase [Plantibacter cousiniae]SKC51983.1 carboxylate-amine ligase [Plantibacter cousiniae]